VLDVDVVLHEQSALYLGTRGAGFRESAEDEVGVWRVDGQPRYGAELIVERRAIRAYLFAALGEVLTVAGSKAQKASGKPLRFQM
jgi:hypothetical protein